MSAGQHLPFAPGVAAGGRRVRLMVWALTVIGVAALLLSAGFTALNLAQVRRERSWLLAENARVARASLELRGWADQAAKDLDALLQVPAPYELDNRWEDGFSAELRDTRADVRGLPERLNPILDDLARSLDLLSDFRIRLLDWRLRADPVLADVRSRATLGQVRARLALLREAMEIAEGRQRLRDALMLRRIRTAPAADVPGLAVQALASETRFETRQLGAMRREVIELSRLCEQLAGAVNGDELVDLKDNQFQPAISRTRRALASMQEAAGGQPFAQSELDGLTEAVFGKGYSVDPRDQTIRVGAGGLYNLIADSLRMAAERRALEAEDFTLLAPLNQHILSLQQTSADFAESVGRRVEAALVSTLWNVAGLGLAGVTGFLVLAAFITRAITRQVAALDTAERNFRLLLESAPDAMCLVNEDALLVLVNKETERIFGYGRDELLGRPLEMLVPERFRERHRQMVRRYFASPDLIHAGEGIEIHALAKDGREFPADISLSPLHTDKGLFVLSDIRDITDRKAAEEAERRSFSFQGLISETLKLSLDPAPLARRLERVLDLLLASPHLGLAGKACIFLAEEDGGHILLAAQRGFSSDELEPCGRVEMGHCLCGFAASSGQPLQEDCNGALKGAGGCRLLFAHRHHCIPVRSGQEVIGVMNLILSPGHAPAAEEDGFLSSIAQTVAGMIERERAEEQKDRLQEQLIQSEKLSALGRLTANVAHEIRNPLMALGGFARRLNGLLGPGSKPKEYAEVIVSEAGRLEKLLRDVLTLTKVSRTRSEPVAVAAVLDASLKVFQLVAEDRGVALRRDYAELPPVPADPEQLREAVDNLVSNAIDAMPRGGTLTLAADAVVRAGRRYARIRVMDTGVGIPKERMDHIFEPFFTQRPEGSPQGIGLGLAITRRIMDEHGGLIEVDSHPGQGTVFALLLPMAPAA